MRVQVLAPGQAPVRSPAGVGLPETYAGFRPRAVLGAASRGGLLLPDASPTASTMYAPRGVLVADGQAGGDHLVVVADTGNHRVLIWHGLPAAEEPEAMGRAEAEPEAIGRAEAEPEAIGSADGAAADVVLGKPDFTSEGPGLLHLPTGVLLDEGRLVVCDAWHHRLLVWSTVPTVSGTAPDLVIGQDSLDGVAPGVGPAAFNQPFGIAMVDGRCYLADTYNRRVLVWRSGLPEPGQPADIVLGQPDAYGREENRGGEPSAASFRWPHAICSDGAGGVWVADAGNHRILGWSTHPEADVPADRVLGQPDFASAGEFPYVSQEGRLRFPYAVASVDGALAVADTANNRVLLQAAPVEDWAPTGSLGQPTLAANGENRWDAVAADTLCWPYGIAWHRSDSGEVLAVADSGNNRVVLWERAR